MSPYMRAYEAGIELAKYQWRSKYAEEGEEATPAASTSEDSRNMSMPEAAPVSESLMSYPDAPLMSMPEAAPVSAPAPAQETQAEAPTSQEQAGPPAPNMFSAVRGGYGNQLRALRNLEGLTDDQRDFLEQVNYRQLAGAMDNRGLRVGDRFDANSLIQRMRQMQASQDQPGVMGGVAMPTIDIQNRRGRDVTRGSLASMRSNRGNQAQANVNPTGGLRGAGAQRPVSPLAQRTSPTKNKPTIPSRVTPDNIDSFMGAPARPAPRPAQAANTVPANARTGTYKTTDSKGGTTTTTLNGMTQGEGNNLIASMISRLRAGN